MTNPPLRPRDPTGCADPFGSTRWSVVLAAGTDGDQARAALEALCRTYWMPVHGFVRARTANPEDANDLTQGFFTHLLERDLVAVADPLRGRFRAFLLTTLKNYLANQHARASTQKRGHGRSFLSLHGDGRERHEAYADPAARTAEQEYERQWALALLQRVMERLTQEHVEAGKARQFAALRPFLTGQDGGKTQAEVARELQLREDAVRASIYRLRKRYRALLRDEVAHTVEDPNEVDDELGRLIDAVGR